MRHRQRHQILRLELPQAAAEADGTADIEVNDLQIDVAGSLAEDDEDEG